MTLDTLTNFLLDIPVYFVNGLLWPLYALTGILPALVSMASAGMIALVIDAPLQSLSSSRPTRAGRESQAAPSHLSQIYSGVVLVVWLVAQWGMGAPVPWIGAAMWLASFVAVLLAANQQFTLLDGQKKAILGYALLVIASRLYLGYMEQITPEQWAAMLGSADSAAQVLANTRGNVTAILTWTLWLVYPMGFFYMVAQQVGLYPTSLTQPRANPAQVLKRLRYRGGR
ncbi:MAG: hypothetical protein CO094_08880 [Anaerolineae bacterium CG_4_9_14_3_um_filter_57_17]|nr:hypothetical protein [bacterium]NCT21669.1 hypothetical protein [bacterium]OIO86738.1 MAG: hypothetical protein AUK01_02250 [Anaerolineae bacterium CG2_30_57_67]PJB65818.1 MAG: hypothetical protein CO094_08880 [Anaerolineae bacterium CG_4_9_14_3_um_filter_57_17]